MLLLYLLGFVEASSYGEDGSKLTFSPRRNRSRRHLSATRDSCQRVLTLATEFSVQFVLHSEDDDVVACLRSKIGSRTLEDLLAVDSSYLSRFNGNADALLAVLQ